jgi:hypothetical protein
VDEVQCCSDSAPDCGCCAIPETLTVRISDAIPADCPLNGCKSDEERFDKMFGPGRWKRRALLPVSIDLFLFMVAQPGKLIEVVSSDVPAGVELISFYHDWEKDRMVLVLEHDSFTATPDGASLPWLGGPELREKESCIVPFGGTASCLSFRSFELLG